MNTEKKRKQEVRVVGEMIRIYCHHRHGTSKDELCPSCRELAEYAAQRTLACPRMEVKTFCSACPIHCYQPEMRSRIKEVMRFAGPRMLVRHPVLTVKHGVVTLRSVIKEKRKEK